MQTDHKNVNLWLSSSFWAPVIFICLWIEHFFYDAPQATQTQHVQNKTHFLTTPTYSPIMENDTTLNCTTQAIRQKVSLDVLSSNPTPVEPGTSLVNPSILTSPNHISFTSFITISQFMPSSSLSGLLLQYPNSSVTPSSLQSKVSF